jgi:hypothetical protein
VTITISADEPRSIRALELAAGAAQWLKCRTRDGKKVSAVPSRSKVGLYHLVDCQACDCMDARRHPGQACMHVLAVRLFCELTKAQQKPKAKKPAAAVTPTGRPVLTMVRRDDGDFTWERRADVERAARYDHIFGTGEAF